MYSYVNNINNSKLKDKQSTVNVNIKNKTKTSAESYTYDNILRKKRLVMHIIILRTVL